MFCNNFIKLTAVYFEESCLQGYNYVEKSTAVWEKHLAFAFNLIHLFFLFKFKRFLICLVGGGIKVHSTLRPLNGLLCQPRVIMIMEKSVE
jgi:hypothetical protein